MISRFRYEVPRNHNKLIVLTGLQAVRVASSDSRLSSLSPLLLYRRPPNPLRSLTLTPNRRRIPPPLYYPTWFEFVTISCSTSEHLVSSLCISFACNFCFLTSLLQRLPPFRRIGASRIHVTVLLEPGAILVRVAVSFSPRGKGS